MIQERKLIVPEEYSGKRLDKIVSKLVPEISRSQLKKSLKIIQVNGKKTKLSRCVARGDEVFLSWEEQTVSALVPEDIPLEIVYEDENVVVINKPSGLVTHPAAGNWTGTLANGLLFHLNRQQDGKENLQAGSSLAEEPGFRTGIVHRLDKETSGLIITAKNFESEKYLQEQFFHRRVQKEYIAILKGVPRPLYGAVKNFLIRDPKNRKRFSWTDEPGKGKFSHTVYRVTAVYGNYSLVVLKLKTGRTHQIRVHMKSLGCPILGDNLYGKPDSEFPGEKLMLCSRLLGIRLPGKVEFSRFKIPVPVRFKRVIKKLREMYPRDRGKINWKDIES